VEEAFSERAVRRDPAARGDRGTRSAKTKPSPRSRSAPPPSFASWIKVSAVPGVGIIPPVGVQWKKSTGKYPFEMQVVDNSMNPNVKVQADLVPTNA